MRREECKYKVINGPDFTKLDQNNHQAWRHLILGGSYHHEVASGSVKAERDDKTKRKKSNEILENLWYHWIV